MTLGKELSMVGSLFATSSLGLGVCVSVEIIVMNVFRDVLSMASVGLSAVSTIGNIEPSSLRLICKVNVCSVLPAQPPCHLVRKRENFLFWVFMKPMVQRAVTSIGVNIDVSRELSLKTGENIVEWESVSAQVNPS